VETAVEEFYEALIEQFVIEKLSPPPEALISDPTTDVVVKKRGRADDEEDDNPRSAKSHKTSVPMKYTAGLQINPYEWCSVNLAPKVS